ncbi:EamA family transporter [Roseibium salinum]|nr:EamA family transporter [Roseibium salinum]
MAAGGIDQNPLLAIFLMSSAMLMIPVMDIIAKYLSMELPPLEITFGRFFFQFLICLAIALVTGRITRLGGSQPVVNYLRGMLLGSASLCFFFTAVKYMSVATAISIFFVEPMVLTVLAALLLKEQVGPRRIGAILVGLIGAIVVLRPNLAEIGLVSLLPVVTAVLFSFYLLINRLYPARDDLLTIQFSAGLSATLMLAGALFIGNLVGLEGVEFTLPSGPQSGLLALIGLISFAGHGLVVSAFQRGSASLLAPLQYMEIVSATLFGYLVFSDFSGRADLGRHFPDHRQRALHHPSGAEAEIARLSLTSRRAPHQDRRRPALLSRPASACAAPSRGSTGATREISERRATEPSGWWTRTGRLPRRAPPFHTAGSRFFQSLADQEGARHDQQCHVVGHGKGGDQQGAADKNRRPHHQRVRPAPGHKDTDKRGNAEGDLDGHRRFVPEAGNSARAVDGDHFAPLHPAEFHHGGGDGRLGPECLPDADTEHGSAEPSKQKRRHGRAQECTPVHAGNQRDRNENAELGFDGQNADGDAGPDRPVALHADQEKKRKEPPSGRRSDRGRHCWRRRGR